MAYGQGNKRLGKRVQQSVKPATPKCKDHIKDAEEKDKLKQISRSLQIAHDPRYKTIEHYKDQDSQRLEKMLGDHTRPPRMYPEPWGFPEPMGSRSRYHTQDLDEGVDDEMKRAANVDCNGFEIKTTEKFSGRIAWEESFKSNVKQLMVDFRLSTEPSCRLNHLERMHSWFAKEGKKQVKKETASPNFLTFEKNSRPIPGTTRDIVPPSNPGTLNLAAAMKLPTTKRLERQFGVVPGPPPPMPGYR